YACKSFERALIGCPSSHMTRSGHFAEIDHQSETVTSPFVGGASRSLARHHHLLSPTARREAWGFPYEQVGSMDLPVRWSFLSIQGNLLTPILLDFARCLITEVVFPGFAWEDHAFLTRTELEKLYGGSDKGKEWAAYVKNG
ncbi:uncharacterized protein B0H18DRAFT_1045921, partial [Fomitopsis serialis]|uniref:uncharacterized protein n=1 Tax=Fomitopsis serialis TaxID=139415 RepID=UPI00200792C7